MSKSFLLTFVSIGAEKVFKKKLKTATVTYLCPDDPPLVKELHHPYVEVPSVCVCVCVCGNYTVDFKVMRTENRFCSNIIIGRARGSPAVLLS